MNQNSAVLTEPREPLTISQVFVEHRIPRDGFEIYARAFDGAGPAFVLLHGFPDNLHIYDQLIPVLAKAGRRVIAFDFLGFGASDKPAGYKYSFAQQFEDLEVVLDFLKIDRIVPVGHDAGGVTAINFALANPARTNKLCLLNTFYADTPSLLIPELIELFTIPGLKAFAEAMATDPDQIAFLLRFQQLQFKIGVSQAQKDIIDSVLQPIILNNFAQQPGAGPAFAALAADLRHQISLNNERLNKLESLDVPSTIIWGKSDRYLNTGVAQDLAARLKRASLIVLDAGHWPQIDLPEEVGRHLLADLRP
jgi:haloalkane dehalogenase